MWPHFTIYAYHICIPAPHAVCTATLLHHGHTLRSTTSALLSPPFSYCRNVEPLRAPLPAAPTPRPLRRLTLSRALDLRTLRRTPHARAADTLQLPVQAKSGARHASTHPLYAVRAARCGRQAQWLGLRCRMLWGRTPAARAHSTSQHVTVVVEEAVQLLCDLQRVWPQGVVYPEHGHDQPPKPLVTTAAILTMPAHHC